MFDWRDEELANIVWGEACETDDHIVPYPEASVDYNDQKEWNREASATKLNEQKRIEAKNDFHQGKLGSSSKLDIVEGPSASESGTNSWPDLSLCSAAKTDHGSLGAEVSKNLEETTQLEKDVEKQGDFVNYAWDNIGSFDDLDRIFSNDDPIFGHVTLDNSDVLWSSKDVSNSTVPTFLDASNPASGIKNRSEPLEIKAEHVQQNDQSLSPRFMKISDSSSHDIQNAPANTFHVGYATDRITPAEKEQQTNQNMVGRTAVVTSTLASVNAASASGLTHKEFGQKNRLKARKKTQGKQEEKTLQEFYGSWARTSSTSGQFQNQLVSSVIQSSPSSTLGQQNQLQGPETLYQDITNTYSTSPAYGNLPNTYASMSMLPQAHSGVVLRQPPLSGYESSLGVMNPVSKSMDIVNPPSMTPQEKIEKLRRRQQMQAMLAIQKQQQEFGHQVPSANKSMNTNCAVEMHSQLCDGADPEIEDLRTLPALDPPSEQDNSNTISFAIDDHFVEDTILYMLQDVISKLDVKIRLCIRDSLFRLAQSAMLRNYASDTSSTNNSSRDELKVIAREESINQNRYARIADVETKTNPIDRTVAHLLFHRPLELTGNYPDKLESPTSAKIQFESKAANLEKFPMGYLHDEDLKTNQQFSQTGFEAQPEDQFKNSHCIDTSDNASNNELANAGDQVLEASQ